MDINLRQEGARYAGDYTNHIADSLGRLQANPNPQDLGIDDQYDAFRHARKTKGSGIFFDEAGEWAHGRDGISHG